MVRVLLYLLVFACLAAGAVWLADRPGEVSVLWQGYRIETSVAIAAIGVVVLAMLAMLLWGIARFVLGLPSAFSFASRARRRARGFEAVSRGMVAIGAGDPVAAGRHAQDARRFAGNEPLTLLLEAQAAQLSGDRGRAEAAFKTMLDKPETRVLGLRGLFVEAKRRGDMTAARAFADDAVRRSPSLAWANERCLISTPAPATGRRRAPPSSAAPRCGWPRRPRPGASAPCCWPPRPCRPAPTNRKRRSPPRSKRSSSRRA